MKSNPNVEALLARLSLREKIGQLLLCGLPGPHLTESLKDFVRSNPVGGIIYFARNVENPGQVAQLTQQLQTTASEADQLPLFISIDQEGGMVARIAEGITLFPGNMAIAAAGSVSDAYEAALASGKELSALGINLNFAPVLDVNNNPLNPVIGVRSFGESPQLVAEYGASAVRGFQKAGVSACAKHFPGHGDTAADSHLDLPIVPHDLTRMKQLELVPFIRAIEEGVDFIMSAHIYFPALESEKKPATLSASVLTGLLREQLGYEGVIMTDCMEMHAIVDTYGTVEASVMALEAGADLVLISHTHELLTGAYEAIEAAVAAGRLSEERINESVRRLLELKIRRGIMTEVGDFPEEILEAPLSDASGLPTGVGLAEHGDIARRISEKSITLVRDQAGMLPLPRKKTLVVTIASSAMTIADERIKDHLSLGTALMEQGLDVVDLSIAAAEVAGKSPAVAAAAEDSSIEQIVIATYNAHFYEEQSRLVKQLLSLGKPLAVIATRNPYDIVAFPDVQVYIAAYESRPLTMRSIASALLGSTPFTGRLPVSLGDEGRYGSVMIEFASKTTTLAIGLMSGTSLDGVDAALVRMTGSGQRTQVELISFVQLPYEKEFREQIKALCSVQQSSVDQICSMNFVLAERFALAARAVAAEAGIQMNEVDFISSHGQTVWHIPQDDSVNSVVRSTLQLGDLSVIAERTGRPVVGDFRPADMAAGGQGAPLVPYGDLILFGNEQKGRILQNIGGIGNCTILPAGCSADEVAAFDTGPGNMIIDQVVFDLSSGKYNYDENGQWAAEGTPDEEWIDQMLKNPYFSLMPPKSTGRELFGAQYTAEFLEKAKERRLSSADIVATATKFTARTIADSYKKWIFPKHPMDEIIVSGGGAHNQTLLRMLTELLPDRKVTTARMHGIDDDAKEALIFALLGNDFLHGIPNNVPSATGSHKPVIMGKLALG